MIQRLVLGIPLALLGLVVIAFLNSSFLSTDPKNIMTIGTLAEASNLNPILSSDGASAAVSGLIFQSLLSVDEKMDIKGELAESWNLEQETTFFFATSEQANAACSEITPFLGAKDSAVVTPQAAFFQLRIHLAEPGLDFSEWLATKITNALPVSVLQIALPKNPASEILKKLQTTGNLPQVVRWFSEGNHDVQLTVVGNATASKTDIDVVLKKNEIADFAIEETETGGGDTFLAEPEIRFGLRKGVCWQDGAPFTSDDVLFTYQAIMDDKVASPRKPDFTLIQEVLAPSTHDVIVRYRKPYAPAINSWRMSIIPAHILRGKSPSWWAENFNRKPVGTGPFCIGSWKTNEYIRLDRNPSYWQAPAPWMDAVVFRVLPDPLTLRLAFETRQVDFWSVDPWAVKSFQSDNRFQIFNAPSSSYTYVGWNLRRPLFSDMRVRKALAHAINVPQMIEFLLYGYGIQSTGIFTPQMWFFDPSITPLTFDPEKARALLAEAGWLLGADGVLEKDGKRFSFTLITNNGNEVRRDIATLIQDDLRKIGIEVSIELYEWAVLISRHVNKSDFDAIVLGWSLPQDDFDQYQIWHSSQTNPEQLNVVGFQNKKVDTLLEKIRQEFNRKKVLTFASNLQQTIYEEQPYLFLFVPEGTSVMWKDAYRICRPDGNGGWIDEPVRMTKAGWSVFMEWFYRPQFADRLPANREIRKE